MPKDHHGAIPAREANSPYQRALHSKLDQLLAGGTDRDEAYWHARRYAVEAQGTAAAAEQATDNAAVVAALGVTYGQHSHPLSAASQPATVPPVPADHGWGSIVAETNSRRK